MKSKLNSSVIITACVLGVAGCSTHVTMTGKAYPPVKPEDVKILFNEKPDCVYEELGFIATPGKWNQNYAIEAAREKAAKIGADYLMIQNVLTNSYNDAKVSALAYKCGDVDREKVDVRP